MWYDLNNHTSCRVRDEHLVANKKVRITFCIRPLGSNEWRMLQRPDLQQMCCSRPGPFQSVLRSISLGLKEPRGPK